MSRRERKSYVRTVTTTVDVDVDIDVELTKEELEEALKDFDITVEPDGDVKEVLRLIETEAQAASNLSVRGALRWARDTVEEHLT